MGTIEPCLLLSANKFEGDIDLSPSRLSAIRGVSEWHLLVRLTERLSQSSVDWSDWVIASAGPMESSPMTSCLATVRDRYTIAAIDLALVFSLAAPAQQAAILSAMRRLESSTAINNFVCVQFRPKVSTDLYYITIQNDTGCSSTVSAVLTHVGDRMMLIFAPDRTQSRSAGQSSREVAIPGLH